MYTGKDGKGDEAKIFYFYLKNDELRIRVLDRETC
jgi:hypothetical protein